MGTVGNVSLRERKMGGALGALSFVCLLSPALAASAEHPREELSDNDVREIQAIVKDVWPGLIVSMNAFRNGCNCEEDASCTAQIDIVGYQPGRSKQLVVSKIGGLWKIGKFQEWCMRMEAAEKTPPRTAEDYKRIEAVRAERPECPSGDPFSILRRARPCPGSW